MLDCREIFFENTHGFIESIVVFLRVVDDFKQCFHHTAHLIVLVLG